MSSAGPKILKRRKPQPRRPPAGEENWTYAGHPVRARGGRSGGVGRLWRVAVLLILMPVLVMMGLRAYRQFPSLAAAKELVAGVIDRELEVPTDMTHASLTITTNPPDGVDVWIDGRRVGRTPLDRLLLDMGPHEIRATHPIYGSRVREIMATRSERLDLEIDFEK